MREHRCQHIASQENGTNQRCAAPARFHVESTPHDGDSATLCGAHTTAHMTLGGCKATPL
jgi:hypothetical protein